MTIFKVRKTKSGKYHAYKFSSSGHDWTYIEVEECEKIKLIFSPTMSQEDIDKINEKWRHKL